MVDCNVLVLDDSDHLCYTEDCLGQDIDQAIANLVRISQPDNALVRNCCKVTADRTVLL